MNKYNQADCNLKAIGIYIYSEEVRASHTSNVDGMLIVFLK